MLTEEALQHLQDNLSGHKQIDLADNESKSRLVSLSQHSRIKSLEEYQSAPNRIKKKAMMLSCQSFCDYVNRFKEEQSSVYMKVAESVFVGILDHHGPDAPSWSDHYAVYSPEKSLEWQAWRGIHKKKLTQVELAMFVEENLSSIYEPEPNVMLQAALDFQANENLVLGSSMDLNNGTSSFTFTKDNASSTVTFPHRINLYIPIFDNEMSKFYEGRIRYKTDNNGALQFTFSFVQDPAVIIREVVKQIAEEIKMKTDGLDQYEGSITT